MARSPASERYRQQMDTWEILATRRARAKSKREGTQHRLINAYHGDAPLGRHAWTNNLLNLARPPKLRSKRAYTV